MKLIDLIETVSILDNAEPQWPRTELIQNFQMVHHIKGCAKINLYDPSLLSTIQCTLQCMGHVQKCITATKTFPISKMGGWKHSTAFQKSSLRTDTSRSNTLDNTDV